MSNSRAHIALTAATANQRGARMRPLAVDVAAGVTTTHFSLAARRLR
jgi:hypothetical protein